MRILSTALTSLVALSVLFPASSIAAQPAVLSTFKYSCVLTSAGGVKCWGQFPADPFGNFTFPIDAPGLSGKIVSIGGGATHFCAVTSDGGLKCLGYNANGELGDNSINNRFTPGDVHGLTNGVKAVVGGINHTCALTTGGAVKCWGKNDDGQLGDSTTDERDVPVDVSGLTSGVTAIAASGNHTCAITSAGGVKCWGHNVYGQLGDNTTNSRATPVDVIGLTSGVTSIAAGAYSTCAITTNGGLKCWGGNGQQADLSALNSGVITVSISNSGGCAIVSGAGLLCWGANYYAVGVGDGSTKDRLLPVAVLGIADGITAVSAGDQHTCALTSAYGVKCWGFNGWGQVGDGTMIDRRTPLDVVGLGPGSLAAETFPLTVVAQGSGSGKIASNPSGIDCGNTCTAFFSSTAPVTLTATPGAYSTFTGWSGACSGMGSCVVTVTDAKHLTASFAFAATVPNSPTAVSAVPGNAQATVSFTPPSSNGGAAITYYTVTASPGGQAAQGSASPIIVTGLRNATAYTFTVTATNTADTSPASVPSNMVVPSALGVCAGASPYAMALTINGKLATTPIDVRVNDPVSMELCMANFDGRTLLDVFVVVVIPGQKSSPQSWYAASLSGLFAAIQWSPWDLTSNPPKFMAKQAIKNLETTQIVKFNVPATWAPGVTTFAVQAVLAGHQLLDTVGWSTLWTPSVASFNYQP